MDKIFLRIVPAKIGWFKFILEGYDGLCVLTTVERDRGIVSISFHASNTVELFALLAAISPELSPYCSQKANCVEAEHDPATLT